MSKFNPYTVDPRQTPQEWNPIDIDLWERLKPDPVRGYTKEQRKQVNAIRSARWLLLTNGRRARCKHCKRVHEYITRHCVERPFNSMYEIQIFEMQQAKQRGLVRGENIIQTDVHVSEFKIGVPVPITRKEAKKLILRIRVRGGKDAI